ncbi:translocation/assembly module TamB domain-containing protein [Telmatospirillum sp.]|uniref:translocation/assembly module TamB domain-containing protein n=1 Tax=Telmatospirillum sp. TaxID=2079197 RepID=UPI0028460ABF|nr:translocation/assembly module TamB domain-containing protein [Telmatospirillum sp.]MDR3435373.1 translocation/assembly module TamB domain-containing protein [Telmatospirillum sp.]
MRRAIKNFSWTIGGLLAVSVLALALLVIGANVEPGRRLVEQMVPKISGGQVVVRGVSGRFPDAFGLSHLEVRDNEGAWLEIDDLALDWSPLSLLSGRVRIDQLQASRVTVRRMPPASSNTTTGSGFELPLAIDLNALRLRRVELDAPLADRTTAFAVQGSLHLLSSRTGSIDLAGTGLDAPGTLTLSGTLDGEKADGHLSAQEPAGGLLSTIAGLPDLGGLSLEASLQGPRSAEQAHITVKAGLLDASVDGTIDLATESLTLGLRAEAPAMAPRADLSWRSVLVTAEVQGPFTRPTVSGHLDFEAPQAAGGGAQSLKAELSGNAGTLHVAAVALDLRIPGPKPDLFAGTPLTLDVDARLDDPLIPATFMIAHPLLQSTGRVNLNGATMAKANLDLPVLGPIAEAAGIELQGHAQLVAEATEKDGATLLTLGGTLGADGGASAAQRLIGKETRVDIAAALRGDDIEIERAAIDGKSLHLSLVGTDKGRALDFSWDLAVADLSSLTPNTTGSLSAKGSLHGAESDPTVAADVTGELSADGLPKSPIAVSIRAQGLPSSPASQLSMRGAFDGAPLDVTVVTQRRADGMINVAIERARWKSAEAHGGIITDPDWQTPHGDIRLQVARLADFRRLLGSDVTGKLDGSVAMAEKNGRAQTRLAINATDLTLAGNSIGRAAITATVEATSTLPKVTVQVTANDISASGVAGNATLDASGTTDILALHLTTDLQHADIAAQVMADATLDVLHQRLGVTMLQARSCGETARLLAPARIDFAGGVTVDHLQIGVRQALLDIAGRLSPKLDLNASLRNVTGGLASQCLPIPLAHGTVAVDVALNGTTEKPGGTVRVSGQGLQLPGGAAGVLAPGDLDVTGVLQEQSVKLTASFKAGKTIDLQASGDVALQAAGSLNVKTGGTMDLAILGPIFLTGDRAIRGQVTLDAAVTGSLVAPCVTGTVELAKGAVQDFLLGVELSDVTARVEATCGALHIVSATAKAGPGTISASGTVDLFAGGIPVELAITAANARPLASDLLTANLDADMTVRGQAAGQLALAGTIRVRRADINIPESFASRIAVLDVQRRGQDRSPPPMPVAPLNLDLTLLAPERVFVRGHGVDAEMSGQIHVEGSNLDPRMSGGFDLRHGTFSLAGKTLNFVSGRVGFDGAGVTGKIDPTLHFVAESSVSNVTATLTVGGYADAPTIELGSVPALPQDEVLAQLIFGQSVKQLSPLQIAQIAQAVASLTNVGGGLDPLGAIRKGLGLDRLSAGSGSSGSGASLQAGKYVANGVYVGAQQGTTGGTRAQVQIDLTEKLKLETTIGTGGTTGTTDATPENDPGSSVGLTYRIEY